MLVLDMLSGRNALMNVDKWTTEQDLDQLLRPGLQASWFNDDALGHYLDRLYEADIHHVYSDFQLHVYQHERIPDLCQRIKDISITWTHTLIITCRHHCGRKWSGMDLPW
ncbi:MULTISPECIES: DUF4277 domain-containing protein [unclassified Paenibacillus]|uniref:DUF4277 domain-containing protein n=1 Tax=unclassified Paenibacillus TaxID=185978 RepID=UPI00093128FB